MHVARFALINSAASSIRSNAFSSPVSPCRGLIIEIGRKSDMSGTAAISFGVLAICLRGSLCPGSAIEIGRTSEMSGTAALSWGVLANCSRASVCLGSAIEVGRKSEMLGTAAISLGVLAICSRESLWRRFGIEIGRKCLRGSTVISLGILASSVWSFFIVQSSAPETLQGASLNECS